MKTAEEVRQWAQEHGLTDSIIFEDPAYAEAVVGIDYNTNAIIYDYDKMAESLMEHEPEEFPELDDAYDFINYNASFGCGIEGVPPIIMQRADDLQTEN